MRTLILHSNLVEFAIKDLSIRGKVDALLGSHALEGSDGASVGEHAIDISAILFEFTWLLAWEQSGVIFWTRRVQIRCLRQCVLLLL